MIKKNGIIIGVIIFVIFIVVSITLASKGKDSTEEVSVGDYDSSYYVEADGNVFIKLAQICDDCCYYVVDMIFSGIEGIFSSLLGN